MKDNVSYYDEFSGWYEKERATGYHAFLDNAELSVLKRYAKERDILEVGCGTGLVLGRLAPLSRSAYGVDLSQGMLDKAQQKGLDCEVASATELPFEDDTFDLTYSVKVLAHVPDIVKAIAEMARVTRPGGTVIAELYNKHSLRYMIKRLRPGMRISEQTTDAQVYTRYDSPTEMRGYLPSSLELKETVGIRVFTLIPQVFKVPVVGALWERLESWSMHAAVRRFGGFMMLVCNKQG